MNVYLFKNMHSQKYIDNQQGLLNGRVGIIRITLNSSFGTSIMNHITLYLYIFHV